MKTNEPERDYTMEELLKQCTQEKMKLTEEDRRWLADDIELPDA